MPVSTIHGYLTILYNPPQLFHYYLVDPRCWHKHVHHSTLVSVVLAVNRAVSARITVSLYRYTTNISQHLKLQHTWIECLRSYLSGQNYNQLKRLAMHLYTHHLHDLYIQIQTSWPNLPMLKVLQHNVLIVKLMTGSDITMLSSKLVMMENCTFLESRAGYLCTWPARAEHLVINLGAVARAVVSS